MLCKCSSKTALRTLAHLAGGEDHFREKAREAAMKPPLDLNKLGQKRDARPYSVFDYYHSTGCAQVPARASDLSSASYVYP